MPTQEIERLVREHGSLLDALQWAMGRIRVLELAAGAEQDLMIGRLLQMMPVGWELKRFADVWRLSDEKGGLVGTAWTGDRDSLLRLLGPQQLVGSPDKSSAIPGDPAEGQRNG